MIKKLKNLLIVLPMVLSLGAPAALVPVMVHAQAEIEESLCGGAENLEFGSPSDCASAESETRLNNIIETVINVFSVIVGVVSVIMIIIGGFKYITSGGDSSNVTNAKNTIMYAIIGLVIVALAQFIVRFVLDRATQV